MYRSVYCGIEVCIASWVRREMMGLWFGNSTFGVSGRLVRNPTSIRRGDVGLRPYSFCPVASRNNIARAASEDQAARFSIHPSAWKDLSPRFIFRCMHLTYR
jgi:hypothetical protein